MHNGAMTIGQALISLVDQKDAPLSEFVVVDNLSSDTSVEVVKAFIAQHPEVAVRLVEAADMQGAAYARNFGAEHAVADRLVFCDCDDLYDARFLWAIDEALDISDIAAADHLRPDEYEPNRDYATLAPAYKPGFALLGYLPTGGGGGLGVHKRWWLETGGFDNSYIRGAEDNDFYWRVQEAGGNLVMVPRAIVVYRHRSSLWATFKQYRDYRRAGVVLQARFAHGVTQPITARGTLRHFAHTLVSIPRSVTTGSGRRSLAAQFGAVTGGLCGLVEHRMKRGVLPPRQLR